MARPNCPVAHTYVSSTSEKANKVVYATLGCMGILVEEQFPIAIVLFKNWVIILNKK